MENLSAQIDQLERDILEVQTGLEATSVATDLSWLLLSSLNVFLMQCGFGMLEAGSVRAKNTRNILMKNLLDTCVGCLVFWLVGWSMAFDRGNPFLGRPTPYEQEDIPGVWFHQYVYAAASSTIVSGAIAERTQTVAYGIHSVVMLSLTYPAVAHWIWSESGWLSTANPDALVGGVIDFAGGGVVHLTGGFVALVAAAAIGPRRGRFNEATGVPVPMPGHSSVLQVLGCFVLWFGWVGFNMGSVRSVVGDQEAAPRIAACTLLSSAAGGLSLVGLHLCVGTKSWSIEGAINGILSGLVSITAGCSVVHAWAALVVGGVGGGVCFCTSHVVLRWWRVDDVLDAFAVHGACGMWGLLATALFATPELSYGGSAGLFYGGGHLLGSAAIATAALSAWSALLGACVFVTLRKLGRLRVSEDSELVGVDHAQHGGSAYGEDMTDAPEPEYPPPYEPEPQSQRAARAPVARHPPRESPRSIEIGMVAISPRGQELEPEPS